MASLDEKAQNILNEKTSKIIPENIKKDVTIFDITGTLETLDTSDSTATADDIASGKTAYVNGTKVTGTLTTTSAFEDTEILSSKGDSETGYMWVGFKTPKVIVDDNSSEDNYRKNELKVYHKQIIEKIGLTADKIKSGETILGITGTYTGE